jgi:hypothetical protein
MHLDFGYASKNDGLCYLRFDDVCFVLVYLPNQVNFDIQTNPETEKQEFIDSIIEVIQSISSPLTFFRITFYISYK